MGLIRIRAGNLGWQFATLSCTMFGGSPSPSVARDAQGAARQYHFVRRCQDPRRQLTRVDNRPLCLLSPQALGGGFCLDTEETAG